MGDRATAIVSQPTSQDARRAAGAGLSMVGALLLGIGCWHVADALFGLPAVATETADDWWATLLVAGGAWVAAQGRRTLGGAFVLLGAVILTLRHVPGDLIGPVLVIGAGAVVLAGASGRAQGFLLEGSGLALFGDRRPRVGADGTRSLVALFGEVEGELGDEEIDGVVGCLAVFGNVELAVPHDVAVEMRQTAIFGDVRAPEPARGRIRSTVAVRGTAIFGDVRIRRS